MPLTLIDAAKTALNGGYEMEAAIMMQFAASSPVLEALPFRDIQGSALKYNREETMPGIGFRGINGSYPESTGIVNPQVESLAIAGGDLDVDKFLVQTMGETTRSAQEKMKVRSLALSWTRTFIQGDSSTTPEEFDGLRKRLTGTQLISAGSTSGGDALSLSKLDELIDSVIDPTGLYVNKTVRRRLTAGSRATGVGGFITYDVDSFGRPLERYGNLPIYILDEDNNRNKILPFTEAGAGGGTAQNTSIYCVSLGDMKVQGIQNGGIQVTDLGELQTKPCYRTRVEWYAGVGIFDGRSAARLYGVRDAAVVA